MNSITRLFEREPESATRIITYTLAVQDVPVVTIPPNTALKILPDVNVSLTVGIKVKPISDGVRVISACVEEVWSINALANEYSNAVASTPPLAASKEIDSTSPIDPGMVIVQTGLPATMAPVNTGTSLDGTPDVDEEDKIVEDFWDETVLDTSDEDVV